VLVEEIARRAAVAIENARLYELMQHTVLERERVLQIVSHDLRNPLATILLNATAVLDLVPLEGSAAAAREPLEMIVHSSEHMERLIRDLLDFSRIQAGQFAVEKAPQEVAPLLAEAVSVLRPLATEKRVVLTSDLSHELPTVAGDRFRIAQAISNLVGNAIRFTPAGGRITLRAEPYGNGVRVCVEDTGTGIPESHLAHLFDPFWKGDRYDRKGTGLGLAIAKGIVEAHGGSLWVESEVGRGSRFFFSLLRV
jgi:signal transduction histidine kinase